MSHDPVRRLTVLLIALLALGASGCATAGLDRDYLSGYGAYVQGDYGKAAKSLRLAASKAHIYYTNMAKLLLGNVYKLGGKGLRKDRAEAMRWYRDVADQGDPVGMAKIAEMYEGGVGVPQDYTEALRWYSLAAAKVPSLYQKEIARVERLMAEKPPDEAKEEADAIAEMGSEISTPIQSALGLCEQGDDAGCVERLERAAETGNPTADYLLATLYSYGLLIPQDPAEAEKRIIRAAQAGEPRAQFNLASIYYMGPPYAHELPKDNAKALSWFESAARLGDNEALMVVCYMYYKADGAPACHSPRALECYRRFASTGDETAKTMLTALEQLKNRPICAPEETGGGPGLKDLEALANMADLIGGFFGMSQISDVAKKISKGVKAARTVQSGYRVVKAAASTAASHPEAGPYGGPDETTPAERRVSPKGSRALQTRMLRVLAARGQPKAQAALADLYLTGTGGVRKDLSKSLDLYLKAARQGEERTYCSLGVLYAGDLGGPEDYPEAYKWLSLYNLERKPCLEQKERLRREMTPEELSEAAKRVAAHRASTGN